MTARDEGAGTMGRGEGEWRRVGQLERPEMSERGLAGQIMDAGWSEFGGQAVPAETWGDISTAVHFALTCLCDWGLLTLAAPVSAPVMDREAVAKIVDPNAWAVRERLLQRAKDWEDAGNSTQDRLHECYLSEADEVISEPLAKADAILALQRGSEPADGSQVEPSTTGAGRQIIPTDDQGGEGT